MGHSAISKIETGQSKLEEDTVLKLAKALECHPGELFEPLPDPLTPEEEQAVRLVRLLGPLAPRWVEIGTVLARPEGIVAASTVPEVGQRRP
jgi:transcriptional regulator with XRE-family HTH domain